MRRSGPISLAVSLAIHGALIGVAVLSIRATRVSPPKIQLVYGEQGGEPSRANIVASGAGAPPAVDLSAKSGAKISTAGLDAKIFGESFASAIGMRSDVTAPLLMTANGGDNPVFPGQESATPKFSFK